MQKTFTSFKSSIKNLCFHYSQNKENISYSLSQLGLSGNPSLEEIRQAYYNLSKKFHPDLNSNENDASKFREIQEAYELLKKYQPIKEDNNEHNYAFSEKLSKLNCYNGGLSKEDYETFKKYNKKNEKYYTIPIFSKENRKNSYQKNEDRNKKEKFIKFSS